ncbi:hypothetical protein GCM10023187_19420 [Nibrella viscosa]|uniref:Sulfite dehydrogenase (Cytochrome) subunit SorB n=1 Tax=Nibrella viscosa TaxID=1084524 RepID=A0ABP8KBE5_9BACT
MMNDKWWGALVLMGCLMVFSGFETAVPSGSSAVAMADSLQKDPDTGLVIAEQLNVVKAHCTSCHSSKLILQNRFTRDGWKEKIRWMQRTQNLWDLRDSEPVVLDYLAKYYGPEQKAFDGRRKPLQAVQWYTL